jgi:hypothetical protein
MLIIKSICALSVLSTKTIFWHGMLMAIILIGLHGGKVHDGFILSRIDGRQSLE